MRRCLYVIFVFLLFALYSPLILGYALIEAMKAFLHAMVESLKPFHYALKDFTGGDE